MMTCLCYVRKMHIQNRSYETNQRASVRTSIFSGRVLGWKATAPSDLTLQHSLHCPVTNLRLCKAEIVLFVERNLRFTFNVSDGSCGVCEPVVGSTTPVSLEVLE